MTPSAKPAPASAESALRPERRVTIAYAENLVYFYLSFEFSLKLYERAAGMHGKLSMTAARRFLRLDTFNIEAEVSTIDVYSIRTSSAEA